MLIKREIFEGPMDKAELFLQAKEILRQALSE
jgi:hypothetical protein